MGIQNQQPYLPFASRSDTSRAAAESVVPLIGGQLARVYQHILKCGREGSTIDACESALWLKHQTGSPRFWDLAGKNRKKPMAPLILETTLVRKTRSGRMAHVYIALELLTPEEQETLAYVKPKKELP